MMFVRCQLSVVRCYLPAPIARRLQRTTDYGRRTPRSGMTLIELLVVIIIMTVVVAAAIPLMSPSNDDRRLREAARGLNTYITGAQARAISLNRPVGVALKRLSQDTNTDSQKDIKPTKDVHPDNSICLEVFYVEQQPPYAGFDPNSRACVALHPKQPGLVVVRFVTRGSAYDRPTDGLPDGWDSDLFPGGTIRPGDVIQINGTRFELLANIDQYSRVRVNNGYFEDPAQSPNGGPPNSPRPVKILARPINDSGQQINPRHDNLGSELTTKSPAPYWTLPSPYKVLRQPTPMADEPYQLPEGTAIDLRASGVGSEDYFYVPSVHDNSQGVLIMFAPEGRVSRVIFSQQVNNSEPFNQEVVDNVYLLVGRRENGPPPDFASDQTLDPNTFSTPKSDDEMQKLRAPMNWLSGSSRWVVIGSQSGRIATIENALVDLRSVTDNPLRPFDTATPKSEQMRSAQILAAREFTREMGQLGGR